MLLIIAVVSSREICRGGSPKVRVDSSNVQSNVERDSRSSRPEPNLDSIVLAPREGIESTFVGVEVFSVRIWSANIGAATLVEVETGVAVRRDGHSSLTLIPWHGTSRKGMQRDQILFRFVNALNNVDLSTGWPRTFLRQGPKGRPSATPVGHVLEVDYNDGLVKGLFGTDPDAVSSTSPWADDVRGIRQHEELVLGSIRKVLRYRLFQSQIIDPPMGRIVLRFPVELLEKIGAYDRQCAFVPRELAVHGACEGKREGQERVKGEIA